MAFHGKMVEGEGGVIFIAEIKFIAMLTNSLPPWNQAQIKKNDGECSSLLVVFQCSSVFSVRWIQAVHCAILPELQHGKQIHKERRI